MEDQIIDGMAETAASWTDDQLAAKIVELLILDKGVINAWDRTIKTMIKITRKREKILLSKAPEKHQFEQAEDTTHLASR